MTNTVTLLVYLEKISKLTAQNDEMEKPPIRKSSRSVSGSRERSAEIDERLEEMMKENEVKKNNQIQKNLLLQKSLKAFKNHTLFSRYQLTEDDVSVVASLYSAAKNDFSSSSSVDELFKTPLTIGESFRAKAEYLASLLDREVLSFSRPAHRDYHYDYETSLDTSYVLNTHFFNLLMGHDPLYEVDQFLTDNLRSSLKPMQTIARAVKTFVKYYPELYSYHIDQEGFRYGNTVNRLMDIIHTHIDLLPNGHQLEHFIETHTLTRFDLNVLIWVYFYNTKMKSSPEDVCIANLFSTSEAEFDVAMDYLIAENPLTRAGLIEGGRRRYYKDGALEISEQAFVQLDVIVEKTANEKEDPFVLIKQNNQLSLVETKQTLEQLVLPYETMQIIRSTVARLKDPEHFDLSRWGLLSPSLSAKSDTLNGCNILLHGEPGTGKTYVAGVLANELGRRLVQIDANSIRESWYGNSEKNARKLFASVRQIIASTEPSPVFLLNEGDQLIHKRIEANGSADSAENTIQSIFLEELETFPGILIVTTNLVRNMDAAMSRRFAYKLELGMPDAVSRAKLWLLHLPDSIPGADHINVGKLADKYVFSGGQIRIVVQNACIHAMQRGRDSALCIQDLFKYADLESLGSFDQVNATKTGFGKAGFNIGN